MEYVNIDAIMAEIDKLKGKVSDNSSYCNGWQQALRMLELSLDTLEVKEIDNIWHDASEELPVMQDRYDGGSWVLDMWVPKFPKIKVVLSL